jgi:CubicO group peptidase (beta-lactamase class C family)
MKVYGQPISPTVPLPAQPDGVAWPTDEWPTGSLEPGTKQQLDALLDQAFDSNAEGADHPLGLSLAFVAIQGGRLVAERYGPTAGPDEKLISWSMAKSFTHAAIGLLVHDGALSIGDPAPIAAWQGPNDRRAAITIDQLLGMVGGNRFVEDYVDEETSHCIEMLFGAGKQDMAAYTAALPLDHEPGTHFNYASGTTNLLTRIAADVVGSGAEFEKWFNRRLLEPIGIDAELTFDETGTWVGSSFLHTTARHFAKFGLLYLRDGWWDGQRLLPQGWVDHARAARAEDDDGHAYGAHWWIWPHDQTVFNAAGYETQRIIVDPGSDLVLVRLGKTPTERGHNVDAWLERIRQLLT